MPTYSLALPFEVSRIAVNTVLFGTASRVEVRLGMKGFKFDFFRKFNTFTLGNFGDRSCWTSPKDSLKSLKKQVCNWTLMVGRSVTLLRWLGCWCACHVVIPDRSLVLHVYFDAESSRNGIPSNGISEPIDLSVELLGQKCPSHSLIFLYELRYRYCIMYILLHCIISFVD